MRSCDLLATKPFLGPPCWSSPDRKAFCVCLENRNISSDGSPRCETCRPACWILQGPVLTHRVINISPNRQQQQQWQQQQEDEEEEQEEEEEEEGGRRRRSSSSSRYTKTAKRDSLHIQINCPTSLWMNNKTAVFISISWTRYFPKAFFLDGNRRKGKIVPCIFRQISAANVTERPFEVLGPALFLKCQMCQFRHFIVPQKHYLCPYIFL